MILGHEVSDIIATGTDVTKVNVGDLVAVNPARPCGVCRGCCSGLGNLCADVYFYGSAARFPHVNGAFAQVFLADEAQCFRISDRLSYAKAACAEPLAVACTVPGARATCWASVFLSPEPVPSAC